MIRSVFNYPVIRLLVAAGLLYGIARWITPPAELLAAATSAQPGWLLLAALLTPCGVALQWWKWRRLVHDGLPDIGERDIMQSLFAGFGLGLLTPGRLGELGRGAGWPGSRVQATMLAAADRLVSSMVTLGTGAGCALYLMPSVSAAWVTGGAVVMGALTYRFGNRIPDRWAFWRRLSAPSVTGAGWAGNAGAAVLFNLVFFTQMFCLLRATGPLTTDAVIAIPVVFAVKTLLPISLMDLGVREGAAVAVLGTAGVAAAPAVQASLMLFGLNVLAPGLAGLLILALGTPMTRLPTSVKRVEFANVRC